MSNFLLDFHRATATEVRAPVRWPGNSVQFKLTTIKGAKWRGGLNFYRIEAHDETRLKIFYPICDRNGQLKTEFFIYADRVDFPI